MEFKISDLSNNVNTLIFINISQILNLDHKLLKTIFWTEKDVKVFLKNNKQLFKIVIDKIFFGITNIIKNKYIILLAKIFKSAIANQLIPLTFKK